MYRKKNPAIIFLNNNTAYLAGVIIGDGHISVSYKSCDKRFKDYRISIDISDKKYLRKIFCIIKTIIQTKTVLTEPKQKDNRILRLNMTIRNKELFLFFTDILDIPKGKKSHIVKVPEAIKNSDIEIQKEFLAGYFDTDGGFRGRTFGFTTASHEMQIGVAEILANLGIRHSIEEWSNKKYSCKYYGIRIRKSEIDNFLKILPLRNFEKLERISAKFKSRGYQSGQMGQFSLDTISGKVQA